MLIYIIKLTYYIIERYNTSYWHYNITYIHILYVDFTLRVNSSPGMSNMHTVGLCLNLYINCTVYAATTFVAHRINYELLLGLSCRVTADG